MNSREHVAVLADDVFGFRAMFDIFPKLREKCGDAGISETLGGGQGIVRGFPGKKPGHRTADEAVLRRTFPEPCAFGCFQQCSSQNAHGRVTLPRQNFGSLRIYLKLT